MKKFVFVLVVFFAATSAFAGYYERSEYATNSAYLARVNWAMQNTGQQVAGESASTTYHAQRVAYAQKVFANNYNKNSVPILITTNATVSAEVDLIMAAPVWQASTAYSTDDDVVATNFNGYRYVCTSAGTTGSEVPVWPMTVGGTVSDGTVTWTCDGPTDTNLSDAISSLWNWLAGVVTEP